MLQHSYRINLSALRAKFSNLRNWAWRIRRQGQRCLSLEIEAQIAKYEYQKTMKKAKKQHWDDFLDDTKNIWQAARYLGEAGLGFTPISRLKDESTNKEVTNGKEIATTLLSSFFPLLPPHLSCKCLQLPKKT